MVRLEDYGLGTAHIAQHLDTSISQVRCHRHGATVMGDPYSVGHGVVRDLEEGRREAADDAGLSGDHRVHAEGLADAGRGEDLDVVLAQHGPDAAGVVGVAVGKQYGFYVGKAPADAG